MNYKLLNDMINYIEENIEYDIDYKKLSKIVGVNDFILQRIFVFISGITLKEYIRKRRLSKAYEEIVTTNNLIVDIAFKYNYNSSTAFIRAFKREYNITPRECRKNKEKVVLFPKLSFDDISKYERINYEIVSLDEITLYCFYVNSENLMDYRYKINNLYKNIKEQGIYKLMSKAGMYAISSRENNVRNYFLGSPKKFPNTIRKKIPKGKYIKFNIGNKEQENIIKMKKKLYKNYLPSTNFIIEKNFDIEYYEGDTCYRYILIK